MEYMAIKAAADKATAAWLENDSAENYAAMVAADDALIAAKAAGLNIIKLAPEVVEGMVERSVFGATDRARKAKKIPTRAEGWKFAGAAGRFTVWRAGKNDYRITDGADGEVIATRQQFGEAHAVARHRYDARDSITAYYDDRNMSGLAALAQ